MKLIPLVLTTTFVFALFSCDEPPRDPGPSNEGGAGGSSTGGAGGMAVVCEPGAKHACYTGPAATRNVGSCTEGFAFCNVAGTSWSFCEGEITPSAENCATPYDENCNGVVNDGCP